MEIYFSIQYVSHLIYYILLYNHLLSSCVFIKNVVYLVITFYIDMKRHRVTFDKCTCNVLLNMILYLYIENKEI